MAIGIVDLLLKFLTNFGIFYNCFSKTDFSNLTLWVRGRLRVVENFPAPAVSSKLLRTKSYRPRKTQFSNVF